MWRNICGSRKRERNWVCVFPLFAGQDEYKCLDALLFLQRIGGENGMIYKFTSFPRATHFDQGDVTTLLDMNFIFLTSSVILIEAAFIVFFLFFLFRYLGIFCQLIHISVLPALCS